MTLPTLINNIQKRDLKALFNKSYSELSQLVVVLTSEYGDLDPAVLEVGAPGGYGSGDAINLREMFRPYLKCIKSTDWQNNGTYFYTETNYNYMNLTMDSKIYLGLVRPSYVVCATENGMLVSVSTWASPNYTVVVDTNGYNKRPNRTGYDLFIFSITPQKSRLVVSRQKGLVGNVSIENYPCSFSESGRYNGVGCSYYALIDKNPDDMTKGYWESLP